jgi:hypothetical protein
MCQAWDMVDEDGEPVDSPRSAFARPCSRRAAYQYYSMVLCQHHATDTVTGTVAEGSVCLFQPPIGAFLRAQRDGG